MKGIFYLGISFLLAALACQPDVRSVADRPDLIHRLNRSLIQTVSADNFSPPVASRIYAYTNLAAYEALQAGDSGYVSYSGQIQDWTSPLPPAKANWQQAMVQAYCAMARHLVYRDHMIDSIEHVLLAELGPADPQARQWSENLIFSLQSRANSDGYTQTRNLPRYETKDLPSSWEPTPPTYGEALEPYWFQLQPFIIDSASQFRRKLDITFDTKKESAFYQAAEEIRQIVDHSNKENLAIAVYWDCNPGPLQIEGHIMQLRKQNTPGGHWIGIHQIVSQQRQQSLIEATAVYAKLGMGIADAFITAWDTKFAYDLIRPETYINRYIDADWQPKLETPLFPEYTSAHSLVSGVAASILTEAHGNQLSFTDTTNVQFSLPPRSFNNFWEAAEEAAYSRILGGIHYQFGCTTGLEQGKELGAYVVEKLSYRNP